MKHSLLKTWLMLVCLLVGVGTSWAETYTLDFEGTGTFPYNSDWSVECTENTSVNHTTSGSKCGSFNFSTVKYITYKNALTNVSSISFWTNRTTNNTTNPTFTLEGSTDGNTWTSLGSPVTPSIAKNTWGQSTITLSTPFTGKVRLKYSCSSTAVKLIDDIVITTTSSKTLQSITVSGTPTKTSYYVGDVLEPAGLIVTGTYDVGAPEVITSGIGWTFNPEVLSAGNTVCDVIASVGSIVSDAYTVNGLTVTAIPTFTAHFSVNGVDDHTSDFVGKEGATITFPEDPSETSGKVFRGWATTPIDGTTNTAPSFVNKTNETLGASDVTYYAVFATANAGEATWNQVKTLANITEGQYVIKNGGFVLSNALVSNSAPAALDAPAVTSGVITGTVEENMIFNFTTTGTNNQFYVKNPSGKYLYATNNNNGLRINTTPDKWTFAVNTTGYFSMKDDNNNRFCAKYKDGSDWRSYNSATATNYVDGGKLELYKLTSNTTYSDYCTSFANVTMTGIEVNGTPAEFWKNDEFNHNGMTVNAIWSNSDKTDVTAFAEFSNPDMATAGEKTVTVTYQGQTTTYTINVQTIANTAETAYTTAQAKTLIDAGKDLSTEVYVAGTISKIESYHDTYKTITYWLDNDAFEVYSGKNLNNTDFTSVEDLKVGDQVKIYGIIKKYNSTYEFDKNNYIVSLTRKTITALTVSGEPTKKTYNVGDAFETAGLVVTATYSDESTEDITTGFDWEIDYRTGNDAFVAGATSVDVMVYTDEVMSEVYTVEGLTVTVPVTLSSIAISGTPTKTAYYAGDAFETAGLVVTGTYSDSHQETITEGIEWTVDPENLTLETTSVDVLASVGSITSEVFIVEGLTVTENPVKTASQIGFTTTSGEFDDDDNISYESFKGDAGTAPGVFNDCIRLYQNGGYITITGVKGVKISEVSLTTNDTYETTTIGYACGDEDAPTTGETVAKNSTYKVSDLDCKSISFYCLGTDNKTRLEIASIKVKYTKEEIALTDIALSGDYKTEFVQNSTFNHDGLVVTATYSDSDTQDVTDDAVFSTPDMTTTGTKTVTVSYTMDGVTKEATYDIIVTPDALSSIELSGEYQTRFNAGETFTSEGLIVTASYLSGRTEDVTGNAVVSAPDMATDGEKTVTVSYTKDETTKTAEYTILVLPENTIFYESFDTNDGTGGNDDQWKGSIANSDIASDNEGWDFANEAGANKCAKFGTGSKKGSATTPALNHEGAAILKFKSAAWDGNNEMCYIDVKVVGDGCISKSTVEHSKATWTEHTILLTDLKEDSQIKFEAIVASNNRFFLDEILITATEVDNSDAETAAAHLNEDYLNITNQSYDAETKTLTRTVAKGNYSTVCLPYAATATNAVLYTMAGKNVKDDNVVSVTFDEKEEATLEAGVPYLFRSTGSEVSFTMDTEEGACNIAPLEEVKGFTGTYADFWLENGEYFLDAAAHTFCKAGEYVRVRAFRCYISNFDYIQETPAAGADVKRLVFGMFDDEETGVKEINFNDVRPEGTIYDLSGRRVQKTSKGIYIINGKKVMK